MAPKVVGVSVYVNWPMMHEAKVVAVNDANCEVRAGGSVKKWNQKERHRWEEEKQAMMNQVLKLGYMLGVSDKVMNRVYEKGLNLNSKY